MPDLRRHLPVSTRPVALQSTPISHRLRLKKCSSSISSPNASSEKSLNCRILQTEISSPLRLKRSVKPLMQHAISRDDFLKPLDPFYTAIEEAATDYKDFSEKQDFLNTVYERFFRGFSVNVADTHGIVYTPQPIVDFMVNSVEYLLKTEFNRSLSDTGVHIIDPFVGTGNFIVRLMQDIQKIALEDKYRHELHCNEVLLLPYYIANLNIEQEFLRNTKKHLRFERIVFADTFELFDKQQMEFLTEENTKPRRAAKRKRHVCCYRQSTLQCRTTE